MFSRPKKVADRWIGVEPINLSEGCIDSLVYTFHVIDDEITERQKSIASKVLKNYEVYWTEIKPKVVKSHLLKNLSNRLLMFVPARVGKNEYEVMLGYEFLDEGVRYSAFFAYNNDQLIYEHIDGH